MRVLSLSLAAASVYEESNRIVHFIRNLPTPLWNIEVQRFLEHLTNERVALSGMQFFTITKSLILKVGITSGEYSEKLTFINNLSFLLDDRHYCHV